jgi:hypothetical protein
MMMMFLIQLLILVSMISIAYAGTYAVNMNENLNTTSSTVSYVI